MTDIDRYNAGNASLEQAVGEAAGGGTSIEYLFVADINFRSAGQSGVQLLAAPAGEAGGGPVTSSASDAATWRDAFSATAPPTRTRPAATRASASALLAARPRLTSSTSRRFWHPVQARPMLVPPGRVRRPGRANGLGSAVRGLAYPSGLP